VNQPVKAGAPVLLAQEFPGWGPSEVADVWITLDKISAADP